MLRKDLQNLQPLAYHFRPDAVPGYDTDPIVRPFSVGHERADATLRWASTSSAYPRSPPRAMISRRKSAKAAAWYSVPVVRSLMTPVDGVISTSSPSSISSNASADSKMGNPILIALR